MELGAFSISLSVKDIEASRQFYEKLGFGVMGGDQSQGWLILNNGETVIGLFHGMFEGNLLTFNPGWNAQRAAARHLHRRARIAAPTPGEGGGVRDRGRRDHDRPGLFRDSRPRWEPGACRPARLREEIRDHRRQTTDHGKS